jgi:iron(III) transport system permease protein
MRGLRRPSGMTILTAIAMLATAYLLLVPLAIQLISALRGPFLPFFIPSAHWGFGNFRELYTMSGQFGATVWATFRFVGGAALISIVLGWGLAWLVVRTNLPLRRLVSVLVIAPYVVPPIVKAQAFYLMLSPKSGVFNELLRALPLFGGGSGPINPFSFSSITIVQGLSSVTFPFLLFVPILQNMDGTLEEASRASGASWRQTLRRVTLPVLWPATLGVILLQVILLLGTLEVPLLFGQQSGQNIFALRMWNLISSTTGSLPQYGLAAVYGMHFFVLTTILFLIYRRATRNADRRASISGKGFRPVQLALGRSRWLAVLGVVVFLIPTALFPLIALIWAAITPFPMVLTWHNLVHDAHLSAFSAVLSDPQFWQSMWRTVIIAGLSATLAVLVATVGGYAVARGRQSFALRTFDLLASASVAIPAVIAGFSAFMLYLVINRWVPLSGTIWALVLTYAYRMSIAYRTNLSATLQIKRELEEAAAASGASRLATFGRIVLPLLLPSMAAVWIQLFILGANEFTLAAFLATPSSRPLSIYIYEHIDPAAAQLYAPNQGAAMALVFTLLVLVLGYGLQVGLSRRAIGRSSGRSRGRASGAQGRAATEQLVGVPA